MTMTRYTAWPAANNLQQEFKQMFDRLFEGPLGESSDESSLVTAQWAPHVDVKEEPNRFVLYADLPGVDPDEIEVSMDKGILSIRGERRSEIRQEDGRFSRIERRYGSFHRRFALPDSADPDGIEARGHNGVLEISIPKRPETTPRRIHVSRPAGGDPRLENGRGKGSNGSNGGNGQSGHA